MTTPPQATGEHLAPDGPAPWLDDPDVQTSHRPGTTITNFLPAATTATISIFAAALDYPLVSVPGAVVTMVLTAVPVWAARPARTPDGAWPASLALTVLTVTAAAATTACVVAGWAAAGTILAILALTADAVLLRSMYGTCRACGRVGSWADPLTIGGRPRVHRRHLPNIRESRQASSQAVLDAREDAP